MLFLDEQVHMKALLFSVWRIKSYSDCLKCAYLCPLQLRAGGHQEDTSHQAAPKDPINIFLYNFNFLWSHTESALQLYGSKEKVVISKPTL